MENIIGFVGSFLKHLVGVLLLCWRRMLRAGIIAFGIGFVLALLVAVIGTGQAFPGALAVVVAALFGAALGYGVALTVLIEEFVLGVIDMLHMLEGDVAKVAHITEAVAEREAGDITQGLRRLIGLPVSGAPRATTPAPTLTLPRVPTSFARAASSAHLATTATEAVGAIGAALAARAAASAPQSATPEAPPAPTGEPVPADRLPRITWTYEHEAVKPPPVAASATPLAETAGAALAAGAGIAEADHLAKPTPPPAPEPTPAPEPAPLPEPAPAPYVADYEAPVEDEPLAATTFDDEPAPTTVPLPQAEETAPADSTTHDALPLLDPALIAPTIHTETAAPAADTVPQVDPAMLTAAPATTPLIHNDDHDAPEPAPAPDAAMGAPAPATTPLAQDAAPEPEPESAPTDTMAPLAVAPESVPAEPEPAQASADESQSSRATYGRITQPIEDLSTAFDRINRSGAATNPRLSAPESGLWERLSQALIDRAGALSGPFAAPQPTRGNEPPAAPSADPSETGDTPRD